MRVFSTAELTRLQAAQDAAMQDTCRVLTRSSSGVDEHNVSIEDFAVGDALICGFEMFGPKEWHLPSGQVVVIDGRVRLPIGTAIAGLDRVRITHRYEVELAAAEDYEVVGVPKRGPSGLVVLVKKVTRRVS